MQVQRTEKNELLAFPPIVGKLKLDLYDKTTYK